jgi:carbamoyl-phosphate synthase large subunit
LSAAPYGYAALAEWKAPDLMSEQICALVTGVGGRSVGHQILHGLLLLGSKYRLVACDASSYSYGLYQVSNRYKIPRANSPEYLKVLQSLIARENVNVLLPGTEPEVVVISGALEKFAARGCTVIVNPPEVVYLCSNKATLYRWLAENGFDVPKSAAPSHWSEIAKSCGFPIIAKPATSSGASRNVAVLNDESEIRQYLALLPPNIEVVFQQYVDGPESEYTVGVMISKSSEIIDSIVMHRRLEGLSLGVERTINGKRYALSTGYSQGYIVKEPFIQSKCEELALKIGARGPLNIQCRVSGGKMYVFEVHPRFSGTSSFRADVGFNEPDVLIRNFHLNEHVGRLYYRTNVAAIRALSNIVVPVQELESVSEILE